jgi:mRNA interferase RelE/StbE
LAALRGVVDIQRSRASICYITPSHYAIFAMGISYSKDALKTLSRMPVNTAQAIRSKIELYASDRTSLAHNVKALKGRDGIYRLRVGDWRILFTEVGEAIAVVKIAPRGSAYD